ncbi:MAG TPA: hypothetical protein VF095_02145 [Bacillota bacterium]
MKFHVRTILLGIVMMMVVASMSACSNEEVVGIDTEVANEDSPSETSEQAKNEAPKRKDNAPSTDPNQLKKENEHHLPTTFKHSQYGYTIDFPEIVIDDLIIDEGKTTKIYYNDTHTLKKKVLLGKIEPISLEQWERRDRMKPFDGVVLSDDQQEFVFVYRPNPKEPYAELVDDDSSDVPEGYIEYYTASELVLNSLFHAGFILGDIQQEQTLPAEFDTQQREEIAISEEVYADLFQWHKHLEQNIRANMSLDEKGEMLYNILLEASNEYPDIQQMALPTSEMENNFSHCMNVINQWSNFPYAADEPNHIHVHNQIMVLEQYVNAFSKQLDEVKRAQS